MPRALIELLGIARDISAYSYADALTVYLEEDEDWPLFEDAAMTFDLTYLVEECASDAASLVRLFPRYSPPVSAAAPLAPPR